MTCPPHHIIYERASGPTSKGECKFCGEKREDFNSMSYDRKSKPGTGAATQGRWYRKQKEKEKANA